MHEHFWYILIWNDSLCTETVKRM